MKLPDKIAGLDSYRVHLMFKGFIEGKTKYVVEDGVPRQIERAVTTDLIEGALQTSTEEASHIQKELVLEGWIEPIKHVPTRKGMALAQYEDRPRIAREDAEKILDDVLNWADQVNVKNARVGIKSIHLYGSLLHNTAEVGDIDLFVEFTTLDLGENLQPEDMELEDDLADELGNLSEYISPSDELARLQMDDQPQKQIYPRSATDGE